MQPILQVPIQGATRMENSEGFMLLATTMRYAFSGKDTAWIAAMTNKLRGKTRVNRFVNELNPRL